MVPSSAFIHRTVNGLVKRALRVSILSILSTNCLLIVTSHLGRRNRYSSYATVKTFYRPPNSNSNQTLQDDRLFYPSESKGTWPRTPKTSDQGSCLDLHYVLRILPGNKHRYVISQSLLCIDSDWAKTLKNVGKSSGSSEDNQVSCTWTTCWPFHSLITYHMKINLIFLNLYWGERHWRRRHQLDFPCIRRSLRCRILNFVLYQHHDDVFLISSVSCVDRYSNTTVVKRFIRLRRMPQHGNISKVTSVHLSLWMIIDCVYSSNQYWCDY